MLIVRAPWTSLPILGDGCLGWGPAHSVTVYPCPCFACWCGWGTAGLRPCWGRHCRCLPCHHPAPWIPFPCGAALILATLTLNYFHNLVLPLWEERFFCSGDLGRVCHCSFLIPKSRFAHRVEEQQGSSWAKSLGGMCREAWQLGSTLELSLWQLPASQILDFFSQYQPGKYLSKWNPDGFFWACSWNS